MRTAIHRAALELVAERGLAGVTVEEISERAGVSPRTFFNYWTTKENAVLGIVLADTDDLVRQMRDRPACEPPPVALREVLQEAQSSIIFDAGLRDLKKTVMRQEPQLHAINAGATARFRVDLTEAYAERMRVFESAEFAQDLASEPQEEPDVAPSAGSAGTDAGSATTREVGAAPSLQKLPLELHERAVVEIQCELAYVHSAFIISTGRGTTLVEEYERLQRLRAAGVLHV
jgi:AcrR family transcriptional regulator